MARTPLLDPVLADLDARLRAALVTAALPAADPDLEKPKQAGHGDWATTLALRLAKPAGRNPRELAQLVIDQLEVPAVVEEVSIAGPGFINFRFADAYLTRGVAELLEQGDAFGRTDAGEGQSAIVEFVSANPTGPLTVGHGRNAVLGDTIANLLDWTGYAVTREYYFNDAGRQMRVLGESVRARYHALADPDLPTKQLGSGDDATTVPATFPEDEIGRAHV